MSEWSFIKLDQAFDLVLGKILVIERDGKVKKLHCVRVDDKFKPIAGTEFDLDAELILLAMGFVHPVHEGLLKSLGVDLDQRGNVRANFNDYQTSLPKVFSAGDMRRVVIPSLSVKATVKPAPSATTARPLTAAASSCTVAGAIAGAAADKIAANGF